MPTMNVSLPAELVEFVEGEVAGGDYASASEVVWDALPAMRRERDARAERLAILRREVGVGLADAKGGRLSEFSAADMAETMLSERRSRKRA